MFVLRRRFDRSGRLGSGAAHRIERPGFRDIGDSRRSISTNTAYVTRRSSRRHVETARFRRLHSPTGRNKQ